MTRMRDKAEPVCRPVCRPVSQLQFVPVLNSGKADPGARRVIRSQARRTRKQKQKRGPAFDFDGLHGPQEDDQPIEQAILVYTPQIPSRVGGDLDFVSVAADIEASILLNIIKVTPTAVKLIFPLRTAMGFPADQEQRMYPIARDAASLHITAFAIEGFIDRVLRRLPASSSRALLHLGKGLALLRDRLSGADGDTAAAVSDATIGAVMKLASVAHFDGDYRVARQHMRGVKRMVDVRGGLDALKGQPGLAEEILRYDIAVALLDGEMPLFHTSPREILPAYPESLLLHTSEGIPLPVALKDAELAKCWRVMRRFSLLVDLGSQTRRTMRPGLIHETMTAVMYRLLMMKFSTDSIDETARLGLLGLCHHLFLQWRDIKMPRSPFLELYRAAVEATIARGKKRLALWLLMVGAVSTFDVKECEWSREMLQGCLDACGVRRWRALHTLLGSFIWVDLMDRGRGEAVFSSIAGKGV